VRRVRKELRNTSGASRRKAQEYSKGVLIMKSCALKRDQGLSGIPGTPLPRREIGNMVTPGKNSRSSPISTAWGATAARYRSHSSDVILFFVIIGI
jgi:hypothetical protein